MPQNNLMGFALDMIQHNPALHDNPNAREMIAALNDVDHLACVGVVMQYVRCEARRRDRAGEIVFPYVADSTEKRATDFASLERKMDGVDNGPCDGFHATANGMNTGFAAVQNALCQGFSGVTQALQAQLAQCCCDTQAAIQQQIASCRCDNQKQQMQTRFENQQNHCATMQAIDKVGDRIVDYLTAQGRVDRADGPDHRHDQRPVRGREVLP